MKNQPYREDVEQVQQSVCQKSRVPKSAASEKDGLESNPPVSAHEVTRILSFQAKVVSH